MARRDALLRLHKSLVGRRNELRKRLGTDYRLMRAAVPESGDVADAALAAPSPSPG